MSEPLKSPKQTAAPFCGAHLQTLHPLNSIHYQPPHSYHPYSIQQQSFHYQQTFAQMPPPTYQAAIVDTFPQTTSPTFHHPPTPPHQMLPHYQHHKRKHKFDKTIKQKNKLLSIQEHKLRKYRKNMKELRLRVPCKYGSKCKCWQSQRCEYFHDSALMKCALCGKTGHPRDKCSDRTNKRSKSRSHSPACPASREAFQFLASSDCIKYTESLGNVTETFPRICIIGNWLWYNPNANRKNYFKIRADSVTEWMAWITSKQSEQHKRWKRLLLKLCQNPFEYVPSGIL